MFKKISVLLAPLVLSSAVVAGPQTVTGVDGVKTLGTGALLAVRSVGGNAEALFTIGWQPIADDAARSKAAELITKCGAACVTVDGNYGISAVAVGRSNGVYCINGKSTIAFPNLGQPVEIFDSCAFWQKAK